MYHLVLSLSRLPASLFVKTSTEMFHACTPVDVVARQAVKTCLLCPVSHPLRAANILKSPVVTKFTWQIFVCHVLKFCYILKSPVVTKFKDMAHENLPRLTVP